jgi:Tol biopolymer transport system component
MRFVFKYSSYLKIFFVIYLVIFFRILPLTGQSGEPYSFNHPELFWRTIETEHFIVHYHQGTQRTANLVAKIAEEIYPHITGLYQYSPKNKTQFIIRDTDDYSNGGAYFYENKIEIWAENMDYILRGTHNWLRDVVSHEYTHIVSIQKSLKFGTKVPAGWFQIFGYEKERRKDVVRGFPNTLISYPISGITIPIWFAEGTAQFQSPSKRFDYRDSHREMVLRDRVVTGQLLDLKEMGVFGKNSIGNESSYNQGYAFVKFLAQTFGDSIVKKLANEANNPMNLDFNQVMKKVTGLSADSTYMIWNTYLRNTYSTRLSTVNQNLKTGEPIQKEGIGNTHPIFSPDGKKIAYLKGTSDYLSLNTLTILNLETKEEHSIDGSVVSSASWSPDGNYLAYTKKSILKPYGGWYFDIYIYDINKKKKYQISEGLRATNPDWSNDGKKLVCVVHSDGLTNLFALNLPDLKNLDKKKDWTRCYYDLYKHKIICQIDPDKKKDWRRYYRRIGYRGTGINQLTSFTDGIQIYHPRWSPDDQYIFFDTSINYCRDIAKIPSNGGELEYVLNESYDERYPIIDAKTGLLYFSSDKTGIYNIYSLNLQTGEMKPHTNVIGGAFMPTVNENGDLVYSLYKEQGYKVYRINNVNDLPEHILSYWDNYEANIPKISSDDRDYEPRQSRPYKRSFGPIGFMPRLLIDYGTIKPGLYVYSNEILDKMFLFSGMDINWHKEYDIFIISELNLFRPTIFLEFYNQTAKTEDDYYDPDGFTSSSDKIKVNFNLMEGDVGLRGRFKDFVDVELSYIYSLYRATINTYTVYLGAEDETVIVPPIRYSYLKGHALSLAIKNESVLPEVDRAINPRKGYYFAFRYTREWNRFLEGFTTEGGIFDEVYRKYYFNRFYLNIENYFPVPFTKHHSFSTRFQGGYIDKDVDDFFHFFAGGLIGLKGYSFYSVGGSKMAIGTLTYRMPLIRNMNFQIFNWYLDKIYLGALYQFGDAWESKDPTFSGFKSDVGVQVRLETFSWYMFPTRIFFEAVYPLVQTEYNDVSYNKEWRYYFGILFDFDLRFDKKFRSLK